MRAVSGIKNNRICSPAVAMTAKGSQRSSPILFTRRQTTHSRRGHDRTFVPLEVAGAATLCQIVLEADLCQRFFHGRTLAIFPRSRHLPVAVTDGSLSSKVNRTGVRLWTYAHAFRVWRVAGAGPNRKAWRPLITETNLRAVGRLRSVDRGVLDVL
jgi:hypothetical protein